MKPLWKQAPITGNTDLYKDKSTIYSGLNTAVVDDVYQEINADGYETVSQIESYGAIIGDKFTSRAGQKVTVGLLLDAVNMPIQKMVLFPILLSIQMLYLQDDHRTIVRNDYFQIRSYNGQFMMLRLLKISI